MYIRILGALAFILSVEFAGADLQQEYQTQVAEYMKAQSRDAEMLAIPGCDGPRENQIFCRSALSELDSSELTLGQIEKAQITDAKNDTYNYPLNMGTPWPVPARSANVYFKRASDGKVFRRTGWILLTPQ